MKGQNNRDWNTKKVPLPKAWRDQQGNRPPVNHHSRQEYQELMTTKTAASNAIFRASQEKDERLSPNHHSRQNYIEALAAKNGRESNVALTIADISEETDTDHPSLSLSGPNSIHMSNTAHQNVTAANACTHSISVPSANASIRSELELAKDSPESTASCCTNGEPDPIVTNDEEEEGFTGVLPGAYFVRGVDYASTTSSAHRSDLDDDEETQEAVVLEDPSEQQEVAVLRAEIADENTDPRKRTIILMRLRKGRKDNVVLAAHVEREGAIRRCRVMVIATACLAVAAIIVGTALGITSAAGGIPDFTPPPPTPAPTFPARCFRSRDELWEAVNDYLEDNSSSTSVAMKYGWPIGTWCVTLVTDFSSVFSGDRNAAAKDFNEDLKDWDMSNATTLDSMFMSAKAFNGNVSLWDTSSVTNMGLTFYGASSFNKDISLWNVSSVTDMSFTFAFAMAFNQDISQWDVSKVTTMWSMFYFSNTFNQDLAHWNVGSVSRFEGMFDMATAFNNQISMWDVSSATDMGNMFADASAFNQNISTWNVRRVTTFSSMFKGAVSFDQPLSTWEVSNAVSMQSMFEGTSSFNQMLSNWDTSQVQDMSSMFRNATAFNQGLSVWDISAVSDFNGMFSGASGFNQDLCAWGASMKLDAKVEDMFAATMCPAANVQVDLMGSPPGPFCSECL